MTLANEKAPGAWQGDEGSNQISNRKVRNQSMNSTATTTGTAKGLTTETDQQAIDAAEAQAWFDARPNALNVSVSEVVRGNRETVWPLILDGLYEMHEIACAKRAELRRNATVATAAGFIVAPDSLLMRSLCNGDNVHDIERGRFMILAGVPVILSVADVARRVIAEHESGNVEFRAADAFQLASDGVRERNTESAGGL